MWLEVKRLISRTVFAIDRSDRKTMGATLGRVAIKQGLKAIKQGLEREWKGKEEKNYEVEERLVEKVMWL